jgi:ribonuclease Z
MKSMMSDDDRLRAPDRRSFLVRWLAAAWGAGLMQPGIAQSGVVASPAASPAASPPAKPPQAAMRVTLLGTGGPELSPQRRQGAATLVEARGQFLLFDAGRGVLQRLYDSGAPINQVETIFLTHLHSDHIVGLPELWITPWFLFARKGPIQVFGPVGTAEMLAGMRGFLASDLRQRPSPFNPAADLVCEPHEFAGAQVIYNSGGVTVSSVPVDHKEGNPAFGFVVEHAGAKLVLSGDCTLSEALIAAGKGADVVIHNVFAPSPALLARDPNKRQVAQKLSSPEQAAQVFLRTGTRHGVYSHVILLDSTEADVVARTRAAGYAGPLTVGEDLMTIHIGDRVEIVRAL